MGVRDSGAFLARCITGGLVGGLVAAAWTAIYAGLRGLPLWSPLALYDAHFMGLSPKGLPTASLANAVVAGIVWQMLLGIALGAFFGLLAGAFLSPQVLGRTGALVGALYGFFLWAVLTAGGLTVESRAFRRDMASWSAAVAFLLIGLVVGAFARRQSPASRNG